MSAKAKAPKPPRLSQEAAQLEGWQFAQHGPQLRVTAWCLPRQLTLRGEHVSQAEALAAIAAGDVEPLPAVCPCCGRALAT